MALLSKEMAAYERMRDELEMDYFGKRVIVHDEKLFGIYDEVEDAANEAIRRFGRETCHIRQVGAPQVITLPASILYRPVYD